MIESVRKAFVTLRVFPVNHTGTIFRCGNLGNVEIFETSQARLWQYNVRRFRGVRMRHIVRSVLAVFLLLLPAFAQSPELSDTVKQFVRISSWFQ